MLELYHRGGPLFMGFITLILAVILGITIIYTLSILKNRIDTPQKFIKKISHVKAIGLFALIIGILGQLISLFSAFRAIEIGAVKATPSLISSGFQISMITTIYGILIYLVSLCIWHGLKRLLERPGKSL